MSKPANHPSAKSRKWKWIVTSLLAIGGGAIGLCFWLSGATFRNSDPAFRGKPESEWVKNLKYWDDEQVKEWRGYGEEGVQVLIRGLQHADHPGERTTRMCLVSLLSSLGNDAKSATPIMIWTLVHDEDDEVRQSTIRFFTSSEDEKKCLLNQLPAAQKRELLPALIRSLQNTGDWRVRNNAANALKWFPEEKTVVAPALIAALQDPQPQVRLLAAEALKRVDPEAATKANAVAIVLALTKDPDDQVAARAISALRSFKATK